MTSSTKHRLFFAAVAVLSLQFSSAQAQTNAPDHFVFGPPVTPVWDISGYYQITNYMQSATMRPLEIVFNQIGLGLDAHGKVLGSGTILVPVGDDIVGGDYKVSGKVSGGGVKTHVNFSVKFKGNGMVAGVATTCNISAKYNLEVNPVGLTMVGKTTGNASFSHLGNGKFNFPISLPLPPGVDGAWNVTLDIYPFGNKLSGTAVVLVDNTPSTTLATNAKGTVAKSLTQQVKLSGSGYSAGTQLTMSFTPIPGASNLVATAKGKVLGQNVKN